MNQINVLKALREVADPGSSVSLCARERANRLTADTRTDEALFFYDVSQEVKAALVQDEPFLGGGGFFVAQPNGYIGFHANDAAIALSRRVIQGASPEESLAWLTRILERREAQGTAVMALWGIETASAIELGSGVTLLPIDDLPESSSKSWLQAPGDERSSGPVWSAASSALKLSYTISPLLYRVSDGEPPTQSDPLWVQTQLDDVRLALTLVGPSHPLSAGHWFQFNDLDIATAFRAGGIATEHIEVVPWGFAPAKMVDPLLAPTIVSNFLRTSEPVRQTLRLALRRFNQALRRPAHGDRALDLAIALESLLVDGAGENTYKLGLRAALLLGGTLDERHANRALISALYTLRSSVVHDGVLPKTVKVAGQGRQPAVKVVEDATLIGGRLLQKVIERGDAPDWYSFELTQHSDLDASNRSTLIDAQT